MGEGAAQCRVSRPALRPGFYFKGKDAVHCFPTPRRKEGCGETVTGTEIGDCSLFFSPDIFLWRLYREAAEGWVKEGERKAERGAMRRRRVHAAVLVRVLIVPPPPFPLLPSILGVGQCTDQHRPSLAARAPPCCHARSRTRGPGALRGHFGDNFGSALPGAAPDYPGQPPAASTWPPTDLPANGWDGTGSW